MAQTAQKAQLKKLECTPDCGFMVRSHNEKEIVEMLKQHAKKMHDRTMTDGEIKGMMKNA